MPPATGTDVATLRQMVKLTTGLAIVFLLFHFLATALGSDRGQTGLIVAAVVLGALMTVEWALFRQEPVAAIQSLGLGQPSARGMLAALGVCVLLLAVIPVYAALRDASLSMHPGCFRGCSRRLELRRKRCSAVTSSDDCASGAASGMRR